MHGMVYAISFFFVRNVLIRAANLEFYCTFPAGIPERDCLGYAHLSSTAGGLFDTKLNHLSMKYDIDKVANLFDQMTSSKSANCISDLVDVVCFDSFNALNLEPDDILLDMGAGMGKYSIMAANTCKRVIGIDISPKRIQVLKEMAIDRNFHNIEFYEMAIEDVNPNLFPRSIGINKALFNYSLHHLPDLIKISCLKATSEILTRPGRIVIGDILFFEDPEKYKDDFNKIDYDGGLTDFPSTIDFLCDSMKRFGADIKVKKHHPLSGIVVLDF